MSRTDLDTATLANSLRMKAGDGSIEWVIEPIQASVLLDIADMLDENAKLVDVLHEVEAEAVYAYHCLQQDCVTTANSSEHFFKKWWHAECELDRLNAENAKLREQVERLVTLLRVDCDIDASWDGLRHFWSIELTEDGCLMRDRACKAEAENAKLRELVLECLSTVCGWAWVLNELTGHDKLEEGTVPTAEFRRLQALARELEVPNA